MPLEPGEVVRLKGDSLRIKMTVEEVSYPNGKACVRCAWFDGESNLHRDTFNNEALVVVN